MSETFPCQILGCCVELTTERLLHILDKHPELVVHYRKYIGLALQEPDEIRRTRRRRGEQKFCRLISTDVGLKHVVVVVMKDGQRYWIVTAYLARRLAIGEIIWKRS